MSMFVKLPKHGSHADLMTAHQTAPGQLPLDVAQDLQRQSQSKTFGPRSIDGYGFGARIPDMADWFVGPVGHHRDSDLVTESNWNTALQRIRAVGEEGVDWIYIRFGHFLADWVEEIGTRPGTPCAQVADEIKTQLEIYPILDEDDLREREAEKIQKNWHSICYVLKYDLKQYCRAEWVDWGDTEDDLVDDLDDCGDLGAAAHGIGEESDGWISYSHSDIAIIADRLASILGYDP